MWREEVLARACLVRPREQRAGLRHRHSAAPSFSLSRERGVSRHGGEKNLIFEKK